MFEAGDFEKELQSENIFEGEEALKTRWMENILPFIEKANLKIPDNKSWEPILGGRKGYHTDYLQQLVEEMGEVFRLDPTAQW
jgi:ring-1,2-phenylacetyl-CoA epoxidase subunit PaaC